MAPAAKPDQQRRTNCPAQVQTHHARELDVAHAHSPGVGEGDQAAVRRRRWRPRSTWPATDAGSPRRVSSHGRDGRRRQHRVGDDPVLEVGQGDDRQHEQEDASEDDLGGSLGLEYQVGWLRSPPRAPARPAGSEPGSPRRSCGNARAAATRRPPGRCRGRRRSPRSRRSASDRRSVTPPGVSGRRSRRRSCPRRGRAERVGGRRSTRGREAIRRVGGWSGPDGAQGSSVCRCMCHADSTGSRKFGGAR